MKNKIIHYTWDNFHEDCVKLANDILFCDDLYEYIYPIPRGGLIPATVISHILDIPLITDSYTFYNKLYTYHKNVLIVDDIVDSGKTMLKFQNYTLLSLFYKPETSQLKPDYYIQTADSDEWVMFPWEVCSKDGVSSVNNV